jgi:plastocyanin
LKQVIAFSLVSVLVEFAWTNFSAYPLETDFGSTANSDNEILLMLGNDSTSVSGSASVSIVPGSSSPNNGKFFVPNLLNISAGTTVTWTNGDLTSYKSFEVEQLHTITSGSLESRNIGIDFDSGFLAAGKTFQHTFVSTGTFDYFCTIHPFMTGKVVVG